jgi:FkbM family methyltransferase
MSLLPRDAYGNLTRVIDPGTAPVFIDVGAHVGLMSRRMLAEFPRAAVYAFEPAPAVYRRLCETARELPGIRPVRAAAGDRTGTVTFHETEDPLMSSVLLATEHGRFSYGKGIRAVAEIEVPIVRLDDWAHENGLEQVHFMKVDAQGLEMAVLRGARELLRGAGVLGINCEAPLHEEYAGGSTFHEIDAFLSGCGFVLYQIHECWFTGEAQRSTCLDALWVSDEAMGWLREEPHRAYVAFWRKRVAETARRCAEAGLRRVALYPAGRHTRAVAPVLGDSPVQVLAVIDDDPRTWGSRLVDLPVVSPSQAGDLGADAVILSSQAYERLLWERAGRFREAGIAVVPIYGSYAPDAATGAPQAPQSRVNQVLRRETGQRPAREPQCTCS